MGELNKTMCRCIAIGNYPLFGLINSLMQVIFAVVGVFTNNDSKSVGYNTVDNLLVKTPTKA